MSQTLNENNLCPVCAYLDRYHESQGECTGPEAEKYRNCFNRIECERYAAMSEEEVIGKILQSNCLSCNFTRQEREVIEDRLKKIRQILAAERDVLPPSRRIELAIEMAVQHGHSHKAHHKAWVINQMVWILAGPVKYREIVKEAKAGEDGPYTYEWDEGIAP